MLYIHHHKNEIKPFSSNKINASNSQSQFFDDVIAYASSKGLSPTFISEVDTDGITHFYLANVYVNNDGITSKHEKLIELNILDDSIKTGSSPYKEMLEQTKERLDTFLKEKK